VRTKAFTLIELLIVVAIIAILAAIAVPNFLEAQTRAKTSRVKSDLRTLGTVLEIYRIDNTNYPPRGLYMRNAGGGLIKMNGTTFFLDPIIVTTPIAYLTSQAALDDPFQTKIPGITNKLDPRYVTGYYQYCASLQKPENTDEMERGLMTHYGAWRVWGAGPDKRILNSTMTGGAFQLIPYDATNGTVSVGDVMRSQKESDISIEKSMGQ